jgi:hypothetical protein
MKKELFKGKTVPTWKQGGGGMREGLGVKQVAGAQGESNDPIIVCTYE